jgi:hypothetical protein
MGLVLKSKAKHAAVAAKLKKPFKFEDKPLVVQYEIAFQVSYLRQTSSVQYLLFRFSMRT